MPKPLVLLFIMIWLVIAAFALQWGFTTNWSDPNLLIDAGLALGITVVVFAALLYKLK